jgi:hypothetical protein
MFSRDRAHVRNLVVAVALLAAWSCIACSDALAQGAGTPPPVVGTKRALLIAVNTYQAVPSLAGSLNDVAAMREVLIRRWGFDERNIRLITEQAATRAGILATLQQLVREAGPNDTVYVHYSGHGSQVQDLNGDEDDGLDETLVPHDGRTPGVPDILDDELDSLFSRLRATSVIVLDSCHSGTATRSLEIRTRSVPRDARVDLYRSAATSTRAIVPRMEARHIVMSAAAANQEALDGPVEGNDRGFFSYALSRSLAASMPNASPRAVFADVEQQLRRIQAQFGRTSMPEPQLEGPPALLGQPLLAGVTSAASSGVSSTRLAWLEVRADGNDRVTLLNGALIGAAPGSTWALYPPGETVFAPGRAMAVATVLDSAGPKPTGDVKAAVQPVNAHIAPSARAVMLMPAAGAQVVPIGIIDVPQAQRAQIEVVLRRTIRNLQLVEPGRRARFLIDVRGESLRLLAADGLQVIAIFDARTDQWGTDVARVVSRSTSASELLAMDNPASRVRVSAQVAGATPSSRDIVLADTRPVALRMRRPAEPRSALNSLQLAITVNTDVYLTIVDVDSEGRANLLFPNDSQRADFLPDGRIPANQPILVPDSLAPGNRAGFFWDYGPPEGLDTIRIFATTDANTARLIRNRIRTLQAGAPASAFEAAPTVAPGFDALRRDLTGLATRGITTVADTATEAEADWGTTTLTVEVVK